MKIMSAFKSLLLLAACSIAFVSCNLEMAGPDANPVYPPGTNNPGTPNPGNGNGSTAKITGSWTFTGLTQKTRTSASQAGGSLTSTSECISINNTGVFVFDDKSVTFTDMSYIVNGTMKMTVTYPGTPGVSTDVPINVIMSPYSGHSTYKLTGNTIHFDEGFMEDPTGTMGNISTAADATVAIDGDNMTLTMDLSQVVVPGTQVSGTQVINFVRKK
ncbi:MAG: hypothetical protein J7623_15985 [Chitinophaga sp.]|uniref:hypothetical protein n=1 Tax=Chitinophaga sp. TaxID=1869181 RepID=UPI001B2C0CA9|nr:hypothetical protein [Chitinophaga sp.]MBO9730139.1 hypothetical protein [Chitinophaga sp.]